MKQIKINTIVAVFESFDKLPEEAQKLMQKAIDIRKTAYAPYSNFQVGTAILLENGKIITGSNQENAAYPSGLCAERVAIFQAGSQYPEIKILKLAITAASLNQLTNHPISPCGSCRQSISEYELKQQSPIEIYFMGETGEVYHSHSIQNLLPLCFNKELL